MSYEKLYCAIDGTVKRDGLPGEGAYYYSKPSGPIHGPLSARQEPKRMHRYSFVSGLPMPEIEQLCQDQIHPVIEATIARAEDGIVLCYYHNGCNMPLTVPTRLSRHEWEPLIVYPALKV